jgi:hypothetical protein
LLAGVVFSMVRFNGYSQGTDIRSVKQKHFYIGFSAGTGQSSLAATANSSLSNIVSKKGTSFAGTFEIGYSFNRIIGLSTGVGYTMYSTGLSLSSYTNSYDTTDSEGEKYTRQISGSNITETQKISFVNIPLALNLQIPFSKSFGLYIQSGINFSIPMQKSFNSTGTFSYSGKYDEYHVVISGVTYEGFMTNYTNSADGQMTLKSMYEELFASAGFQLTIHNSVQIALGGFYNKMLSDMSDNSLTTTSFHLSSGPGKMESLIQGTTKPSLSSMGVKITLRFYL